MSTSANVHTLRVLPLQVADLCFPVHGIIAESRVLLGQYVDAVQIEALYLEIGNANLGQLNTNSVAEIYNAVYNSNSLLMALRSYGLQALLAKALAVCANRYTTKYQNAQNLQQELQKINTDKSNAMTTLETALSNINGAINTDVNTAQYNRSLLGLKGQELAIWLDTQNIPNLLGIWNNEIVSMNLDVQRLQIAYLDTLLMSPISGYVTEVRKSVGDYVKAGEPVVRVENNTNVLLVGEITYAGIVGIGAAVTVTTTLPGAPQQTTVQGNVVAAIGSTSDDEKWDITVSCNNTRTVPNLKGAALALLLLPINVSLDPNNTTFTFN